MSTSSYEGRHRAPGRHRAARRGVRVPTGLKAGFILPSAAAAALVVTTTGATVAESAPAGFDLTGAGAKASAAKARDAKDAAFERTETQQQREAQVAAASARVIEAQRIARSAERQAVIKKQARAAALKKAEAARKAREKWVMPVSGAVFTSGYGWRWGRMHQGDDLAMPLGTPLAAMSSGTVTFAGAQGGYGNKVEIEYWDGTVSYYAHMNTITAYVGQKVSPGEVIGYSGNTGRSTGPHLHLEIHPDGGPAIDPAPWLENKGLQ